LFIAARNIETLACLKSVLEEKEFEPMQEHAKMFAASRTVNVGYKAYRRFFEGLKTLLIMTPK
jgi:hypothetical protein